MGQYTSLDDPAAAPVNGLQVTQITGINDSGEIAGFSVNAQGVRRGVDGPQAASLPLRRDRPPAANKPPASGGRLLL